MTLINVTGATIGTQTNPSMNPQKHPVHYTLRLYVLNTLQLPNARNNGNHMMQKIGSKIIISKSLHNQMVMALHLIFP